MNDAIIADTPEKVRAFSLLALKGALKLECIGLKKRGSSAYSIVKRQFGFKGSKQKVYMQFVAYLHRQNILG